MLDQVLSWLTLVVPVALGLVVILVPAKREDERSHMRWRYILGASLILYGGLSWWQQSRTIRASTKDRADAIRKTSTEVAAETSKEVTKAVTDQYSQMVADQKSQITQLQSQLAAQGKDVSAIKGSNIVTGKNPIKVEVMNETASAAMLPVENVKIFWESETSIHPDAPYAKKVTIQAEAPVDPVLLNIVCDAPLKYGELGGPISGHYLFVGSNEIAKQDARIFIVHMESAGTALLRPDSPLVFHLYSDKPINIVTVKRGPR